MAIGESLGGHDTPHLMAEMDVSWNGYNPNAQSQEYVPVDPWIIPDRILTDGELGALKMASVHGFDQRTAEAAAQWGDDRAARVLQDRLDSDPVTLLFDAAVEVEAHKAYLDEEAASPIEIKIDGLEPIDVLVVLDEAEDTLHKVLGSGILED